MKISLRPLAERDLVEITAHGYVTFGVAQTDLYTETLIERLAQLTDNPRLGPALPERMIGNCRFLTYRAHVAIYRIDPDEVSILRVLDARTDWRNIVDLN